jgi:[ribosomal protein S18]-alanine N-acetyltransferase
VGDFSIRPMRADDLDHVLSLESPEPEAPHWERTAYASFLMPAEGPNVQHAAWVAVQEDERIGFGAARIVFEVCDLESIFVAASHRKQGIGLALMGAIHAWAKQHACERIELEVRESNRRAIRFYERIGFLPEGRREEYYRHPDEAAVLMALELRAG